MALSRELGVPLHEFFAPFFYRSLTPLRAEMAHLSRGFRSMPIDVVEEEHSFEVKADIPGVAKEDIHVSVEKDVLRINVETAEDKEEKKEEEGFKYHRIERSNFFAGRALRMPDNADLSTIKASYVDGVLSLAIPKVEPSKATKISIE